jgi:hypothetical protein
MLIKDQIRSAIDAPDAIGIVVKNPQPKVLPSRAAAFVWGAGVFSAPSLPFGRWKTASSAG